MTSERELLDAFNDCLDRLAVGQSTESCLAMYPQHAVRLRPMLETSGEAKRMLSIAQHEVVGARERVRRRFVAELQMMPAPAPSRTVGFPIRRLVYAAAVVILVGFVAAVLLPRSNLLTLIESLTPETSTPTTTPSLTPSPSATMTYTASATASASATLTETATPTPSETPTATPSPSPSASPSPSPTATPSATSTASSGSTTDSGGTACTLVHPPGWVSFRVRTGDTVSQLASDTGSTLAELIEVNCLTNPSLLRVGQTLFLRRLPLALNQPTAAPTSSSDGGDDGGDDDNGGGGDDGGGSSGGGDDDDDDVDDPDDDDPDDDDDDDDDD